VFRRALRTAKQQARLEAIRNNQQVSQSGQGQLQPVMPANADTDVYTPQMLDYIQRQLRLMAEGHVSDPNRARHARNLREVFLDRIEDHYPTFRDIRRNYATRLGEFGEEGALQAGRELVPRMGQNASQALRAFDEMTPAQQELYRIGFAQRLMDDAANPQYGHQVAAKFNTPAFRQIINRLYAGDADLRRRGANLIRDLRREAITTRTKNEIMSGSRTAELQSDMAEQMQSARTAADAFTGRFGQIMENMANRLASQIGQRSAREVLRILTETDPAQVLPILNRLARSATTQREARAYRDAMREWMNAGRRRAVEAGTATAATTEQEQ